MAVPSARPARRQQAFNSSSAAPQRPVGPLAAGLAGAAVALGAAGLYALYRSKQAERETPPIGRFVHVDGVRLHYLDRGTGEPIVLLHGNWTLMDDFIISGLVDRLAGTNRVIVIERPGFGHSSRPRSRIWGPSHQAELLTKAFAMIGIDRPTVVGHSWGTLVAVALGLNHPEAVRSLALISGYYYPSLRPDVPLQAPLGVPLIGDLLRFTLAPLATRASWPALVRTMFKPNAVPARFDDFPEWMVCRPSQLRAIGEESGMMIPSAARFSRRYGELTMPVFIMAGGADNVVDPAEQSMRLHEDVPGSVLRIVPEVGHMIHHVAPDRVAETIVEVAERGSEPELFRASAAS